MENIQITLPDGSIREVPSGTTAAQIASQIGPRLAKDALVARVDGELVYPARGNAGFGWELVISQNATSWARQLAHVRVGRDTSS